VKMKEERLVGRERCYIKGVKPDFVELNPIEESMRVNCKSILKIPSISPLFLGIKSRYLGRR